ncbi:MAG: hypothetical protein ACXWID_03230 [Pyrinomonadaceae bacterium]
MTTQPRIASRTIAVFLGITLGSVLLMSIAIPAMAQQFIARLTTTGNQPVTVNNASAASGASLLTGATIETPAAVSATIKIGTLGTVTLKPNSSIKLEFSDSGNVRVKVLRGCVSMSKKGPNEAEAYTAEGSSEKTNSTRKSIGFCYAAGKLTASK